MNERTYTKANCLQCYDEYFSEAVIYLGRLFIICESETLLDSEFAEVTFFNIVCRLHMRSITEYILVVCEEEFRKKK